MRNLLNVIESISEWSGKIVSYLVWIGAIMLSWEVVARYWFNAPTVWAHGYSQRIFGTYFIMVGAFTLLRGGHVRVDLITSQFSFRVRKVFDLVNYSFLILWAGVLIREGWLFFLDSWSVREVDEMVLAHPVYPIKFMLLFGAILIFLQAIGSAIQTVAEFRRGEQE
ncbi:TRAP transporter small permease subunit [Desulfatitalea tepidiphila]|uniref:TRAP transporter small permease subunit n=1 Tax=Desulfatitalea tepidiphila TaxID=1185843 RepID=UPI0006B64E59|nr:TRAP transporter small permease subunit [Desulfatitalea tepidiphila]